MKRFHVHVAVADIAARYRFLFHAVPARNHDMVRKPDYAKWMLDDPRIRHFAISKRTERFGVNHLGLQVDSDDELRGIREQLAKADSAVLEESGANCCYATSDDVLGELRSARCALGDVSFIARHPGIWRRRS